MKVFHRLLVAMIGLLVAHAAEAKFLSPLKSECVEALGDLAGVPPALRVLLTPDDDFGLIPLPKPADWLHDHIERGQTFSAFCAAKPNRVSAERRIIYFKPIGHFSAGSAPSLEKLRRYAEAFFQLEVKVLPVYEPAGMEFSPRVNPQTKQLQVLTGDVLAFLAKDMTADAFCVIGVTMQDIYPGAAWNYVFGQASPRQRAGVYSFARYDPEFFDESRAENWQDLLLRRCCKVLAHETGHIFGLAHCIYYDCAMNGANHLAEADARTVHLCPVCLRKLQWGAGFDAVKRYRDLAAIYRTFGWGDDAEWCERQAAKKPVE